MANIKKNFNFRNGVQVDDDNLLVTDTGLVGIGTTIPNEALDVRGNVVVTGFTSSSTAQIGILTVTKFEPTQIVGAGLSVFSGIVTAVGSGILTYFGDARNLQGMPTSQWEDKDVGLGFTSIYNTGGNVGVGTEDPRSTFQVGNNADAGEKGVGISSVGNINMTGILTASSFIGAVTGDVLGRITGDVVGNINSTGISTFSTLDVDENLFVLGISTFSSNAFFGDNVTLGSSNADDIIINGKITTNLIPDTDNSVDLGASGNEWKDLFLDGTAHIDTLDVDANAGIIGNLTVTGISTFQGIIEAPAGMNKVPSLYMNQSNLPSASDYHGMFAHVHSTGRGYFAHAMNWYELVNKDLFGVVGTGTERYNIGITTISDLIVSGTTNFNGAVNATTIEVPNVAVTTKLGVGTTETPASDIQVRKTGNADVQVTSTGGIAALNVGKEVGTSKTHTSEIRFGGGAGAPYSASGTSLDIINYDTGNFNYHISGNNGAAVAGDFHWHKGINSARLMTLTGIGGSLGIGKTQPSTELDVEGAGAFSGNLSVGNNLTVAGTLIGNVQGQLTGNVQGTLAGNTNATVGVSTLNNITVAGVLTATTGIQASALGVNVAPDSDRVFRVNGSVIDRLFVSSTGGVGIKTSTDLPFVTINASQANASIAAVGVGVTVLKSAVDLSTAGVTTSRHVIMPKMNNAGRGALQNVTAGSVIYNTQTNTLQVYNGSAWRNVSTTAL